MTEYGGYNQPGNQPESAAGSTDLSLQLQQVRFDLSTVQKDLQSTRSQANWLKLLVAILIVLMGGGFSWAVFRLQSVEEQAQGDAGSGEVSQEQQIQLNDLQNKLSDLEQEIPPGLAGQLQNYDDRLSQIGDQIESLRSAPSPSEEIERPAPAEDEPSSPDDNERNSRKRNDAVRGGNDGATLEDQ